MNRQGEEPGRSLGTARRLVSFAIGALLFWSGAALANLCALLLRPLGGRPRVRRGARRVLRGLFRFWMGFMTATGCVRFDVREVDRLRRLKGTVVVSNHPTLMDAFYLLSVIPDAVCIFKRSLQRNPLLGPMASLCGFIANEAGPDLVREAGRALAEGCNLLIFPEGTRNQGIARAFKPGFALIAVRHRAPIQTVHLDCRPALFPGKVGLAGIPATRPVVSLKMGCLFKPSGQTRTAPLLAEVEASFAESHPTP